MTDAERLAKLKSLETTLHEQLHAYFIGCREVNGPTMVYDNTGPASFVVVAFNHIIDPQLVPEDADPRDKEVAIATASNLIAPDVEAGEEGTIGPDETMHVGVHAVAGSMLLGTLQNGPLIDCMKLAQSVGLSYYAKMRKLQ